MNEPADIIDMDDPQADDATHIHIGDDVDLMRWRRIKQELAKIPAKDAEIARLKVLVRELATELKHEIVSRYETTLSYPFQMRRYDNDMETVRRALKEVGDADND